MPETLETKCMPYDPKNRIRWARDNTAGKWNIQILASTPLYFWHRESF